MPSIRWVWSSRRSWASRRLAYDLQRFWDRNDGRLIPLRRAFQLAAGALVEEIVALTLLVSGTLQ
jgi:hypothetical protein